MQIINNIALITINETLFVQLVSFLIFLFLINRIMFRPLRNVMVEREDHINGISTDIETSENQLAGMDEQLRIQELTAIKEANDRKNKLEEDGALQASEIMNESRKEIQAIKEESQKHIDSQIAEARAEVRRESEKLAVVIIEKVLDRRMTS